MTCLCDECTQSFGLVAGDSVAECKPGETIIEIRSCDSGGVYAVYVVCPHCKHQHDLD